MRTLPQRTQRDRWKFITKNKNKNKDPDLALFVIAFQDAYYLYGTNVLLIGTFSKIKSVTHYRTQQKSRFFLIFFLLAD